MKSGSDFNIARQIVYRRTNSITKAHSRPTLVNPVISKDLVIGVLMEIAVEQLTSLYSVIRNDFGFQGNTIDCYRALLLFKCRKFCEADRLCERILHEPDMKRDLKNLAFANLLVIPPLDSLFDRDVQSLLVFHTLLYYLSPLNDNLRKFKVNEGSTFAHYFVKNVFFHNNGLSFFLLDHYFIKCHYFLGRHFLARYLKVRCCIGRDLPYKAALIEFAAHKSNLPFELIVRRFLLQNLRVSRTRFATMK